jgi:nitroreductase
MDTTAIPTTTATRALAEAARFAGRAPSIHNTQPWHWWVRDGVADLYAVRTRQLRESDPDARMLITSCGTALHHACVALAAQGFAAEVVTFPDRDDPDHLARVTISGAKPVTPEAMRRLQTLEIRRTDRRTLSDEVLPDVAVTALRSAATRHGIGFDVLDHDQVIELAVAVEHAQHGQVSDAVGRDELAAWTGGRAPAGTGVPDANIPDHAIPTTVAGRDFARFGVLTGTDTHDAAARYAILYGVDDEPGTWLRAGQALSEVWLSATERDIAVLPLSAPVESPATRVELRRILAGVGYPSLALRIGIADQIQAAPPRTPRLPAEATVDADA